VTDIGGQLDVLFSLRGEELLMDLMDYPDEIKALQYHLDTAWIDYFWHLEKMTRAANCGFTTWMPIVSDKPYYSIQCDFSVMISPAMFEEFVLPPLQRISKEVGCTIYHLDGPEEIKHLDMLLTIENLHAIQWTPVPRAQPDGSSKFFFNDEMSLGVYRRAKAAGKKVAIFHVDSDQVQSIYEAVGTDGVFILSNCKTRKEADDLVDAAKHRRWVVS
jgi:5-methyltetrahydrofolate--homocysteine methyltransferase